MPSTRRRPYAARMPPDERREQLLDAAVKIIAREGYPNVSIDAIAREAEVTRPVVYSVFDGLGPLLFALLDRQEQRALRQLGSVMPPDATSEDAAGFAARAARELIEVVRGDPLTWRPILFAPEDTPEAVRERIARDRELVRKQLATLIEAGLILRGNLKLDPEILSHALLAILEHFGRLLLDEPERFETERLVEAVSGVLNALST